MITWPFFNFEPKTLVLAQEISDFFVVDLKVGDPDQELDVVVRLGDVAEDVSEAIWNYAWKKYLWEKNIFLKK